MADSSLPTPDLIWLGLFSLIKYYKSTNTMINVSLQVLCVLTRLKDVILFQK